MRSIVQKGDPVLAQKARELTADEIQSPEIQQLIADMQAALAAEHYGVAIAAPQVGESVQLFIVAGKVFSAREQKKGANEDADANFPDRVYINPQVLSVSRKKKELEEGCLSVRGFWGSVPRAEKVTIAYVDESGAPQKTGASGFLAQVFQHEIDHLHGTLYTDKATDVWEDTGAQAGDANTEVHATAQ